MCGRFVRITPIPVIAEKFKAKQILADLAPSYNIAPSQEIVIIKDEGVRQLIQCIWGFIPSWAKDPSIGNKMINARSETVSEKPAFRSAFKKKRCLVIADGFYEWRADMLLPRLLPRFSQTAFLPVLLHESLPFF
jgi:putative SOS response-associated peptidase YedK